MKLKEYTDTIEEEWEFTCWDNVIDSEFYLYKTDEDEEPDLDFPNVENLMEYLKNNLEVKEIHKNGVVVGLYELLDNPVIIEYAKEHLYEKYQYSSDEDVAMLLFDDMYKNISDGYENFSGKMLKAFKLAYPEEKTAEIKETAEIDAILVERNYKGELERFALTPNEFKEAFPEVANLSWPIKEADTHTLRPLVHIWFSPCKVGDELWNTFFTDMQWGLSEGDLKDGYEAYIREDFMGKLKKYLSETENQLEGDDLRKLYILTCTHETRYGVDTYTSVHSTQVEALGYVENVKANCDYGEYGDDEFFNYDITISVIDISRLEPVKEKTVKKEEKQGSLDLIIQNAAKCSDSADSNKNIKSKEIVIEQ